jgi:hypothetical protein
VQAQAEELVQFVGSSIQEAETRQGVDIEEDEICLRGRGGFCESRLMSNLIFNIGRGRSLQFYDQCATPECSLSHSSQLSAKPSTRVLEVFPFGILK